MNYYEIELLNRGWMKFISLLKRTPVFQIIVI